MRSLPIPGREAGLVVLMMLAAASVDCRHQLNFSIPVCETRARCHCQLQGWIICDDVCVDPRSDPGNCGGCGKSCGGRVCVAGVCADDCGALQQCGSTCTTTLNDPYNCGGCGIECEGGCSQGTCGATAAECAAKGQVSCDGVCVILDIDRNNCGICGRKCTRDCARGACCNQTVCNGLLCVDLMTDPFHCGACNRRCVPPGQCIQGSCR